MVFGSVDGRRSRRKKASRWCRHSASVGGRGLVGVDNHFAIVKGVKLPSLFGQFAGQRVSQ